MLRSRQVQIGVVLVVVAIGLSLVARATAVPDWLIVVLFVVAAALAYFVWPGSRADGSG